MVIPTTFERPLLDNELQNGDSKWSARSQNRFLVLRKLGQGTYGKVQLALNKETNQEVAIKTIKKTRIESEEDMLRIRREIHIMKSISHPHIIHIHEVFETRQKIVIVMQYASGGELYDYLGCHHTLPEEEARRVFRQIVLAIYYCHKNQICHRDLKLENILLDDVGNAQIADFGLSNLFDDRRRMNTFCGSPLYASPEIVKGTPYKGPEVDCWSLGVLLYTLIYGTMPFDGRNFKDLVSKISEGRYEEPVIKSSASSLIRRLLTPDISRRATIFDVCRDPWLNKGYHAPLQNIAEKLATNTSFQINTTMNDEICIKTPTEVQKDSLNGHMSPNCALYEQILNYDVSFVLNKLLMNVESSVGCSQIKENTFKTWLSNGEINGTSKVESAYVIPIFEVTSVVPKNNKMTKNSNCQENINLQKHPSSKVKNSLPNGVIHKSHETHPEREITNEFQTTPLQSEIKCEASKDETDTKEFSLKTDLPIIQIIGPESKTTNGVLPVRNRDNSFTRIPSVKKKCAIDKFVSKHFFRTTNNALSLARIFSLKYDQLVRTTIQLPKKLPGKIAIPSTFDPSIAPNAKVQEKKQILLFPTVSVSENKEKIEKKIDKIKKAALNRNLIKRSSSKNRLKIQKYLLSQAKKMQDLICDEQRSTKGSMEHLSRCEIFSNNTYQYEKGNLYSFNVRHHNKKMNFTHPNTEYCSQNNTSDWVRINTSIQNKHGLEMFTLSKSKSDVQFPNTFAHSNESSSICLNEFFNNHYVTNLSMPMRDYSTGLQRSLSEGFNVSWNKFQNGIRMSYPKVCDGHLNDANFHNSQSTDDTFQNESLRSNCINICEDLQNANYVGEHFSLFDKKETDMRNKINPFQPIIQETKKKVVRRNSLDCLKGKTNNFQRSDVIINNSKGDHLWAGSLPNEAASNFFPFEKMSSNQRKDINTVCSNIPNDLYTDSALSSRPKSQKEEIFSSDETRQISQGIIGGQNNRKTKFLSKFLNNLEQNSNIKDSTLSPRRYESMSFLTGKQPPLEKRSKSFLQLLSLKRIQEAEKELGTTERNTDTEESSAGSLLEALKTHGYKGVISQLFQGTDNNSLNLVSPIRMENTRNNTMYSDSQLTSSAYDVNDLDLPHEIYESSYKQKHFVCDWLNATPNLEYKSPLFFAVDIEPDEHNSMAETPRSYWELSGSESREVPNDQPLIVEESCKKHSMTEFSDNLNSLKTEKNPRVSSTSEDEREESVQDRIWRKSFYSRFNNSALLRKGRSALFDSEFSIESRVGINGPFKISQREGRNKDPQLKKVHTARKYSLMNDSNAASCLLHDSISSNESLTKSLNKDSEKYD